MRRTSGLHYLSCFHLTQITRGKWISLAISWPKLPLKNISDSTMHVQSVPQPFKLNIVATWTTSLRQCIFLHWSMYLSVVQFEGGVVVVGVVVNPLVNHCHMAIDLLPPFFQRPILSTLPATALICPAAQRHTPLKYV